MKRKFTNPAIIFFTMISILIFILPINVYAKEAKIRVIKEDAVVRLKPNKESLIIKKLPLGSELYVVETIGE